jgi:phosphate-selective porin OprO/OprP
MGAVQLNLRYDYLDLNDAGITGGTQNGFGVSLVWTPTDYTRFIMNYGRMEYDDAAVPAGIETSYTVDAFGMRAQVDF